MFALNKKVKFLFLFYILLMCSCSTSTKTANVAIAAFDTVATVGAISTGTVPVGGVPLGPGVQHQIQIKGLILCEKEMPLKFSLFQIEFWEKDKLTAIIDINEVGAFESIHKTSIGDHLLRLVEKRTNKVLDQIIFKSTEQADRFFLNLRSCK